MDLNELRQILYDFQDTPANRNELCEELVSTNASDMVWGYAEQYIRDLEEWWKRQLEIQEKLALHRDIRYTSHQFKMKKLGFAYLGGAHLIGASLNDAKLSYADLSNARLNSAYLNHADLVFANLTNTDLHSAYLTNALLAKADLSNANLGWTTLVDANFSKADLSGADFHMAILNNTDFRGSDLRGAILLYDAISTDDDFQILYEISLDVQGARRRTNWGSADFRGATYDDETIFPEGFDPESRGMVYDDEYE